jgi:autotransporter-associated beta strand protein
MCGAAADPFQAMNTYTGGTDIYGGTLTLSGHASIANSYLVSIETGCELIYAENAGFTETETNQLNGAGQIVDNSSPNSTINYQAVDAAFLASGGSFRNNTGNPSALLF